MGQQTSNKESAKPAGKPQGSQTLVRGLEILNEAGDGPIKLADLAERIGLSRSTTHRLANALVENRFLTFLPREGYQLGPKLLQLGFLAQAQTDLVQVARPLIEDLATATEDTVHLGRRDGDHALYLDKIAGRRRVEISSRIGDRQPLTCTGVGKALLLDDPESEWDRLFADEYSRGAHDADHDTWAERMRGYVEAGFAYDLEENQDLIRCVAAPLRDASGGIVAAISVSSAAQYMNDERMSALSSEVSATASAISSALGWDPDTRPAGNNRAR